MNKHLLATHLMVVVSVLYRPATSDNIVLHVPKVQEGTRYLIRTDEATTRPYHNAQRKMEMYNLKKHMWVMKMMPSPQVPSCYVVDQFLHDKCKP